MKALKIGDLVKPLWGHLDALGSDFGVVTGYIESDISNNPICSVYWFLAGQTYPVFINDLQLVRSDNENLI